MYPTSLIGCYKYLSFTWRNGIQMLHSTGFSPLTACPVIPGHFMELCLYIQCHEGGNTPTHT